MRLVRTDGVTMDQQNKAQRAFASRLLAAERPGASAGDHAAAAARVYEKISLCLAPLVGATGVRALFVRSLVLTIPEYPFLGGVLVEQPEAGVNTLRASLQGQKPDAVLQSAAALFGTFLTLLSTYVGDRLTAQVLRTAWPDLAETFFKETK